MTNALNQCGPWKDKKIVVTNQWLATALEEKAQTIDWEKAQLEVSRFVSEEHASAIELWSNAFFLNKIKKLSGKI